MEIDLKTCSGFALISGAALSTTGPTTISNGLVGSLSTVAGFPPGQLLNGSAIVTDSAIVSAAMQDLTSAYNSVKNSTYPAVFVPGELGGVTLNAGIYYNTGAITLATGNLTLDGPGQYVFRFGAAMSIAASVGIIPINGALADSIVWQVTGAFAIGANVTMSGTVLCYAAIAVGNQCTITGQLLSLTGALAVGNSTVVKPDNAVQLALAAALQKAAIVASTAGTTACTIELPSGDIVTNVHRFGESSSQMVARITREVFSSVPVSSDSHWMLRCNGELMTSDNFIGLLALSSLCVMEKSQVFWNPLPADILFASDIQFITLSGSIHITVDTRFCVRFTQRQFQLSLAPFGCTAHVSGCCSSVCLREAQLQWLTPAATPLALAMTSMRCLSALQIWPQLLSKPSKRRWQTWIWSSALL